MPQQIGNGYCYDCMRWRKITRQIPHHLVHLILTVFTCGFWLPAWGLAVIATGPWHCDVCGNKLGPQSPWERVAPTVIAGLILGPIALIVGAVVVLSLVPR
jgi:hypothetical protein